MTLASTGTTAAESDAGLSTATVAMGSAPGERAPLHPLPGHAPTRALATVLLLVAGGIHLLVVPDQLEQWRPAGIFFLVVAVAQVVLAILVAAGRGVVPVLVAIWSSVALAGLYVWTRTAGLPFVPTAGHSAGSHVGHAVGGRGDGVPVFVTGFAPGVESAAPFDYIALASELLVVALLIAVLPRAWQAASANVVLGLGITLLALRFAGILA